MYISDKIEIVDLGLKINDYLIISDTQLGYEESLNKKGIMIPRSAYKQIYTRLKKIVEITKPKTIIINGDIKHEFGTISDTEWRYTLRLIDFLTKRCNLILIKGNHDTILQPIAKKKKIELADHAMLGDVYISHGHIIPQDSDFKKAKTMIIGHAHPAISLREKGRIEKFKCFLKGRYLDKDLIVQPSFNLLTQGSDVLTQKPLSPILDNILEFEVFIVADEILYFGKVKDIE